MLPRKRKPTWIVDARLRYGQLKKMRRGRKLQYIQTEVLCGSRQAVRETLEALGFSSIINTSFIERLNLTIRQSLAYLSKRTLSHARSKETLEDHLELVRCHYNFVRPHRALRFGRETRTPAMRAGLTTRRLTLREVFVCTLTLLLMEIVTMAFRGSRTRAIDTNVRTALAA